LSVLIHHAVSISDPLTSSSFLLDIVTFSIYFLPTIFLNLPIKIQVNIKPDLVNRHVPLRTCLGCGTVRPKQELLRLVRDPNGEMRVDAAGQLSGRGAYVCQRRECAELLRKKNALQRGFRQKVSRDAAIYEEIINYLNSQHE